METPNSSQTQWKPASAPAPAVLSHTMSRVIALGRGLTGLAGVMSLLVLSAEVSLPDRYKPSTVIGGFHGRVEAADAEAKKVAVPELARRNSEAAAQPPAFAGMETEAFRQQQQVLADSLSTQSAVANTADAACVSGKLIPRDSKDWGWLGDLLSLGCGVGDQVRQDMMTTLKRGGQNNSVLIQRPRAGNFLD